MSQYQCMQVEPQFVVARMSAPKKVQIARARDTRHTQTNIRHEHKHTSGYAIESVRVGAGEGGVHTNVRNTQTNVRFCDRERARERERESAPARGRDVCTHANACQVLQ